MRMSWIPRIAEIAELTPEDRNKVLIALAILMALVVVGGVGILLFRRRLNAEEGADASANVGFSLSDLREMRDRGEITAEEYDATRAKVIVKVKASLVAKPPRQKGQTRGDTAGGQDSSR
jgi:hypothetical protein